ncbi:Hypothetical predicted protein [Podarcis lilfordi]|uniref:Uncharacterized protein n=1 Tax=Podarcis lilfordi TaxID=74358 RepID=A0AA35QQ04_9SAUR|nr:Hypothetical predicted protein [Podarcis lilfordi]
MRLASRKQPWLKLDRGCALGSMASQVAAVSSPMASQALCYVERRPLASEIQRGDGDEKASLYQILLELMDALDLLPALQEAQRLLGACNRKLWMNQFLLGRSQKPPVKPQMPTEKGDPVKVQKSQRPCSTSTWGTAGAWPTSDGSFNDNLLSRP